MFQLFEIHNNFPTKSNSSSVLSIDLIWENIVIFPSYNLKFSLNLGKDNSTLIFYIFEFFSFILFFVINMRRNSKLLTL